MLGFPLPEKDHPEEENGDDALSLMMLKMVMLNTIVMVMIMVMLGTTLKNVAFNWMTFVERNVWPQSLAMSK